MNITDFALTSLFVVCTIAAIVACMSGDSKKNKAFIAFMSFASGFSLSGLLLNA